jgi:hypothetical protein
MAMHLNGWRRLGLVAVALWLVASLSLALFEHLEGRDGYFVGRSLPVGTLVRGNQVALPDGRIIPLRQTLGGHELRPWEIKWDNEPEVPTVSHIRWPRLVSVGVAFPLGAWLALELLGAIARWVMRGFRRDAA